MNREIEASFNGLREAVGKLSDRVAGAKLQDRIRQLFDLVEEEIDDAEESVADLEGKVEELESDDELEKMVHTLLDCLDRTGVRRHTLPDTGEAREALLQLHYAVGRQP